MTLTVDVSVVIPTLNGGADLTRLLDAISIQEGPFRPRVVAVDSGSTDCTLDVLRAHGARILTVASSEFNHGDTRNQALRSIETEFAVLTVQDALPTSHTWLAQLVEPLVRDSTLAGTWARQRPRENASRLTAHYLGNWIGTDASARIIGPLTTEQLAALTPAERHLACAFDNVCSCIRVAVWRQHPFRTTPIAEDLEWAMHVLQSGHRLAFVPDAVVWHSHERSALYELRRTYVVHQRLQALFGLSTVPDVRSLLRALAFTLPLHLQLAVSEPRHRMKALTRALGLALAFPLGQYLGARSVREGREFLEVRGV
jgi:glycosyltransferase involved in cell wall biosynthesis